MLSDEILKHVGVKGMRWGVHRDRNRPGGADGKEESEKVVDTRGKIRKNLDSMKRERQWHKALRDVDKMTTKQITTVTKRVALENSLKRLSKTKIATKKDKEDYLRREFMSDQELSRKVTRLQAKDSLHKTVREASKEQREFGEKVVQVASSVGVKYAINRNPRSIPKDIFDAVQNPKSAGEEAKKTVSKKIMEKVNQRQS